MQLTLNSDHCVHIREVIWSKGTLFSLSRIITLSHGFNILFIYLLKQNGSGFIVSGVHCIWVQFKWFGRLHSFKC